MGFINTPKCIYNKLTQEVDVYVKDVNFKLFGIESYQFERARLRPETEDFSDEASFLLKSSTGEISVFIDGENEEDDQSS